MAVQDEEHVNETHLVLKVVQSLQQDVKSVDSKCDKLSERFGEFTRYMIEAKALDQAHRVPEKLEAQDKRIQALEHALTAAKAFSWFATALSTLLGLWTLFKAVMGK